MKTIILTRNLLTPALALAALGIGSSALAQQVPAAQTTTADPGLTSERFREQPVLPGVSPQIEVREFRLREAPEGADGITFRLDRLAVEGATIYSEDQLAPLYGDRIGQVISLADLYAIAADMTRKYRNDGYVLTQVVVPPQTIESGTARLRIVEGTIADVKIEGEETPADEMIEIYASDLVAGGSAMNMRQLERTLLLINDLPGVKARGILSPSPAQTGAADLTVIVERKPFDALVSVDNHGSRYLGPLQVTAAASLNNYFFDQNERLTAQIALAPDFSGGYEHEMTYVSLGYEQPVWSGGTKVRLFGSATNTDPGYDLDRFDVNGRAVYASAGLEHPFIRSRALNLNGRALFDWRDVESRNAIEATREDRIRAVRVGGALEFLDTGFLGVGVNALDIELAHGLDVFGASENGRDSLSRPFGDPTFFKMEASLQRLQRVTNDINLLLAFSGQWANNALLSSEEFGVGGYNLGRAYDPSEIVGDQGIAGKLEFQWNQPYPWALVSDYQLFAFYDAGRVWNEDATSNDLERESITSAGLGLRTEFSDKVQADIAVAFPLNRDVATQGDDDPRFYVSVSRRF